MSSRPLLLDLFCGAGGSAVGYHRAGFDVIGVDINPQPNYPFEFIQDDALAFVGYTSVSSYQRIKAVHASPPCQRHSAMSSCRPGLAERYPDLIGALRRKLQWSNRPYVIENVPGAPLTNPVELCGTMFGYELYRHRLFESNVKLIEPLHPEHVKPASKAGHWKPGTIMSVAGHVSPIALARDVMDIDWTTRDELAEAIPPYYTEFIGAQLLDAIRTAT
jgi:DNA (cytosine-5)-methyltransferase 1